MPPNMNRVGYQSAQLLRTKMKGNLHQIRRVWQTNYSHSSPNVMGTIRKSSNQSLRYLGLAGALGLGGMMAYGLSRPASYVPSETRDMMSNIGGATFARTVRMRIMKTFGYLSGSLAITGATAFILFSRGMPSLFLFCLCFVFVYRF